MRDCPKCSAPIADSAVCCNTCGWQQPGTAKAGSSAVAALDPHRYDCIYVDRGQRCAELGRFSESTTGGMGRLYCEAHFPPFGAMRAGAGKYIGPTPAFKAVSNTFKRFSAVPLDDVDAETVAERAAIQGESSDGTW